MSTTLAHITFTDVGLASGLFLAGLLCGAWLALRFSGAARRS